MKQAAKRTNTDDETYAMVAIASIDSVKNWNPRTTFEKDKLQELADDIRFNGVVEPLILRKNGRRYQVIAGERRLKAASKAGLSHVPSIIREMDDERAFQQTISENLNRVDLHPIEEARAFDRLRKQHGLAPKEISKRTGKTVPYVVNRLQLTTLSREVADLAMEMGDKLPLGHLHLVAEIGGGDVQMEYFNKIIHPPYSRNGEILGYDQARRELEKYQRPISSAQFKTGDPNLTSAPPCPECPQNTTNLPREIFNRKDICTNLTCFKSKQHATLVQIVAKGEFKEVRGTKEMFPYNNSPNDTHGGWKDLDSQHYDYRSGHPHQTYRQWFKKFCGAHMPQVYVTMSPHSGRILYVVKEDEASRALSTIKRKLAGKKAKGNGSGRAASRHSGPNYEQQAREATLAKLAVHVRETVLENVGVPSAGTPPTKR